MLAAISNPGVSLSNPAANPAWKEIVEPIRPFMDRVGARLMEQIQAFDPEVATYAEYALGSQGKNLRPALVALSGGAVGSLNDSLVTVATIIEMVHLATLVHDDVMDSAELRRQRPTLAANWGNEISVLVGDCLFAQAVRLAASFSTPDVCRAVAQATQQVCSGEILQTQQRRNFRLSRGEYLRILQMKTAELFALSCELGASLAGGTPSQAAALRQYGVAFGTAYQIYDDCADIFGEEEAFGKSLGTDIANGKLTLPVLLVLEGGEAESDRKRLQTWLDDWHPGHLPELLAVLERHNAGEHCCRVIEEHLASARASLDGLPPSPSRAALAALTSYLKEQTAGFGSHSHRLAE